MMMVKDRVPYDSLKFLYQKDNAQLKLIGYSMCGVGKDTKLWPELLEKIVLSRTMQHMANALGRVDKCIVAMLTAAKTSHGKVDMVWLSPYDITWEDGMATHISHRGETYPIARGLQFSQDGFNLKFAAVDDDAFATDKSQVEKQGRPLKAFFPVGSGPHQVIITDADKKLQVYGKLYRSKVAEERAASEAWKFEEVEQDVLVSPEKALARKAALESARAKYKKQKLGDGVSDLALPAIADGAVHDPQLALEGQ